MPVKYYRQRLYNRVYVAIRNKMNWRNLVVSGISLAILLAVAPILMIVFFSNIYAKNITTDDQMLKEAEAAVVFANSTTAATQKIFDKCAKYNFSKVIIYGTDENQLTQFASKLDPINPNTDFMPDYAASNLSQFCTNLAAQNLLKVAAFGSDMQLLQLAYACENLDVEILASPVAEENFSGKMRAGINFAKLIFEINSLNGSIEN